MSAHTDIRLESPNSDGTTDVVAYLSPHFETAPNWQNDVSTQPGYETRPPIARDFQRVQPEIVLQGNFPHSDNVPQAHRSDLDTLFGGLPVSARDQVNRVMYYMTEVGGPFYLYDGPDEYTAESDSAVDIQNGVFPTVQIAEFRPPREAGLARNDYTIRLAIGIDSLA